MVFVADLHIHSKYSRATSRQLDLESLYRWAQLKGISVVGTGDFTHPTWFEELSEKLEPAEQGLYRLKDEFRVPVDEQIPDSCKRSVRFILQVEISSIYKKGDKTRKVHNLVYAPDLETAGKIRTKLDKIGNISSDGRPILGLDSRDLLEIVLESGPDAYLIPAHIWTPWFSALGSKSGFDSIEECFGDLSDHIFALETGLSSDPEMNWRLSMLDRYSLVSNSDAHSPDKLGRESNRFDTELSYPAMMNALKTGRGYLGTIEFYPEEGKYHLDGHRKCNERLEPGETKRLGGLCPVCGKPVTVGVMHRVDELADRDKAIQPKGKAGFVSLIPLTEVISEVVNVGPKSKKVMGEYYRLIRMIGPELYILQDARLSEIASAGSEILGEAVRRLRAGEVHRDAGYDGEFGVIRVFTDKERDKFYGQGVLFNKRAKSKKKPLKKNLKPS